MECQQDIPVLRFVAQCELHSMPESSKMPCPAQSGDAITVLRSGRCWSDDANAHPCGDVFGLSAHHGFITLPGRFDRPERCRRLMPSSPTGEGVPGRFRLECARAEAGPHITSIGLIEVAVRRANQT